MDSSLQSDTFPSHPSSDQQTEDPLQEEAPVANLEAQHYVITASLELDAAPGKGHGDGDGDDDQISTDTARAEAEPSDETIVVASQETDEAPARVTDPAPDAVDHGETASLVVETTKPIILPRFRVAKAAAGSSKQLPTVPNHSSTSTSGQHLHRNSSSLNFVKSSSPAAHHQLIDNNIKAGNDDKQSKTGDEESGNVPGNDSLAIARASSLVPKPRRQTSGAEFLSTPSIPNNRRILLDSRKVLSFNSAAAGVESRSASLPGASFSLSSRSVSFSSSWELHKWSKSVSSSSLKGPAFGRSTSLTLTSPKPSSRPPTPDISGRNNPSVISMGGGASKPSVKSPKTSNISASSRPSNGTSLLNGQNAAVTATIANRKTISPVGTASMKGNSYSSGSLSSSVSNIGKPPASLTSSARDLARRKSLTPATRDSRYIALPPFDMKAGDDVRLDLRGQKVRSLDSNLVNLTPKLEFLYLRDNKLSTLAGIEILRRVKVLDLSFNEFKGVGFEPLANCKSLQQLYLAGNQITSLSGLPQLPNLEFLSVAQNKLKSLAMETQPRLQVLAASKNKISTFKGLPQLPLLEHLRLEENPILDMQHVEAAAILLIGPTLKKFNDKDLSLEEQDLAPLYPPQTAICIRDGWEFCDPEEASESSLQFLAAQWADRIPPGYVVKEASIDQPSEEGPCWCHFSLKKQNDADVELTFRYHWFLGGKTPSNFVFIEGAIKEVYWPKHEDVGHCLKVECTPVLGATEYPPIFAVSFPVSRGTGCPKVMSIRIDGELKEGNVIQAYREVAWCGGTPSKGIVSWLRRTGNSSPVVIIGAEESEYLLSLDDVDSNILLMYTPVTEEGVKGEPQFATTTVIQAAAPQVSNVHVLGDMVEGNTIKGVGSYFGGREGTSKFEWLREDIDSGEFKLSARETTEYTLSEEDAGVRIMFIYTPVNLEGHQGDPVSAITGKVLLAPPKVTQLRIVGDIREGNNVEISATISGGIEGASQVQWFKANTPDESLGDSNLTSISNSKLSKDFHIPVGAVGFYLAAKYTPVRLDGETGESALVFSDIPVEMLHPSVKFLSLTGHLTECEILTASYEYVGGHEGRSQYSWFLHENEKDIGILIPESTGLLKYEVKKDALQKFISFKCLPVRDDGVVGEARTVMGEGCIRPGSPKLLSLQILGDPIEGTELRVEKAYWGGVEGPSMLQWFLTRPDGAQQEIKGATSLTYTICVEDIGCLLCISCEPIRSDGAKGPVVVSKPVGPILPALPVCKSLEMFGETVEGGRLKFNAAYSGGEKGACTCLWIRKSIDGLERQLGFGDTLDLTTEDVGCQIELVHTPVRSDGVTGIPQRIVSDVVKDADPVGIRLVIPDCCQDIEVTPQKSYFGGREGDSEFTWFRLQNKIQGSEIPDESQVLANSKTYTPKLDDVGTYLALHWIPTRLDGKRGKPSISCSSYTVAAAPPSVHHVTLEEVSPGTFVGEGLYYGGLEGESQMSWYRQASDGTMTLIVGANSKTYLAMDEDYSCSLIFGYTPVRLDGSVGRLVLSEPSAIILPELPRVQNLVLTGKAVEGETLTAMEVRPKSEKQQHIWAKYKKDVKYQWSRSCAPDVIDIFEALPLQRGCSYKVRSEDIGFSMHCECVVTDIFGRMASPVSVVTSIVAPGMPKVSKLEIEGQGFHTNCYALRGIYSGGKEGKSIIQWFRALAGSPDLIPISGEVKRMYEANVDDIGYRLVAAYTPVRDDGMEGTPVSASTEPVTVEPDVAKEVKQKLDLGAVKFEALRDQDHCQTKGQQQQGNGSLERRTLDVNRKRMKLVKPGSKTSFPSTEVRSTYGPPFHVELCRNDQHRFKIVFDSENEVVLMVQTQHIRDVIVLVIRSLAQRFNNAPLNFLRM